MPQERLSMRKIKEVLRLRYEKGLSHRAIAGSCGIGCTTVREYVLRAQAAGVTWPLPADWDDGKLGQVLFPPVQAEGDRPLPDWPVVHQELRRKGVTLALLWQEYKAVHPEGYNYSRFCELYRAWAGTVDVTMHQEHKAGEKLFVDYAGPTLSVTNPQTGEIITAYVFVATQGASNYTYAEASFSMDERHWVGAHVRAFEFFGGINAVVTPDNAKVAVTTPCRYEPDLNPTYHDLAVFYGFTILPTRIIRPRDKAKVEAGVLGVERWVMAPLRHRTFFSLAELNQALYEQLERYNARPFQKLEGSRRSWFETLDRPALAPLPATRYEFAEWKRLTVNIDYHVEVEGHRYSVPYRLVHQKVDVRITQSVIEIFCKSQRVASHARSPHKGRFTTVKEHMPKAHQEYAEWSPERLIRWAEKTGPYTAKWVECVLASRPHPEQGFRTCMGVMRLGGKCGSERLEAACRRALHLNALTYKSIESILAHGLENKPLPEAVPSTTPITHDNLRGPQYYQEPTEMEGESLLC